MKSTEIIDSTFIDLFISTFLLSLFNNNIMQNYNQMQRYE